MELNFLIEYINPVILGICLLTGYTIKTAIPKIPNRYIPLSGLVLGTLISVIVSIPNITLNVILSGMISGLASTGLYEMLKNLLYLKKERGDANV